jgi:hypothetical protein
MQCPECKGSISAYNFFREKHCPACGAVLKRMPTWPMVKETVISFAEDKGYIFWAVVYIVVVNVAAFFEAIIGHGILFDYLAEHGFKFLLCAAYTGSFFDYIVKANVEVTAVRNKFIFKPPRYLRHFRNWTNIFAYLGLGLGLYAQYQWPNYISFLWTISITVSVCVALIWAIMGLILTEDDMNDKRIRYFMEEMRIGRVKYYHRASLIYIGGIAVAGITYYNLVRISGLWFYIWNSRPVYDTVTFFTTYFAWVKKFQR